jgi:hypothetical protein
MKPRRLALTGPAAAAVHGLDGFRDIEWQQTWCVPWGGEMKPGDRTVRTRAWPTPKIVDDVPVCPIDLVIRHLNAFPADLLGRPDGLSAIDRVELAFEHAARLGHEPSPAGGGCMPGDVLLRQVMKRRGDTVPTESYAETRAVQVFRQWDIHPWRQIPIMERDRISFPADFLIPFRRRRRRPDIIRTCDGVLVEIDSREFHENEFERDHDRGSTYDSLGFHWISITPRQIEQHHQARVRKTIDDAFRRAGQPTWPHRSPNSPPIG